VVAIQASERNLSSIAFSPGGGLLATSGLGGEVKIWELPSGTLAETLSGHETAVGSLRFIDGGDRLVSLGYEGTIRLWDARTWEAERVISLDEGRTRRLVISPDEHVAALSMEARVQIWNANCWERTEELDVGTKAVGGLAFSPDGAWFAAGGADGRIRVWKT
jgi:WD40 repeat protein